MTGISTLMTPRVLAAWALLGYVALFLFFEFFELFLPGGGSVASRAVGADFRSLVIMALPVLAVILAAHVSPPIPGARLVATIALVEYAIAIILGLLTLLIGFASVINDVSSAQGGLGAVRYFVMGAMELALIAVAAYAVLQVFIRLGGRLPTIGRPTTTA